ncbi:MAG TPA: hypothetical protein VFJ16_06010 [Longimicrobium sp.]|nr:hypothetical protein [Longimicrobium sp.]
MKLDNEQQRQILLAALDALAVSGRVQRRAVVAVDLAVEMAQIEAPEISTPAPIRAMAAD